MTKEEKNYLLSISLFGEQIKQSFAEALQLKLPTSYFSISEVVVCGMGGSQLPVDLIRSLFADRLTVSVTQIRGYDLPKFVSPKTLVVLLSYSGTTEEVLACAKLAKLKKAKIAAMASGGLLKTWSDKNQVPAYIFKPFHNPSGQPRLGTGYIFGGLLAILKNLKKFTLSQSEVRQMVKATATAFSGYSRGRWLDQLAVKLNNKIPVLIGAEHLSGNAHIMANQINESSKQLAIYFSIPELNHHLLEGLTYPKSNRRILHFLFIVSQSYSPAIIKRFKITEEILARQKFKFTHLSFNSARLTEAMELLVLGGLLSYRLALGNKVNPNQIPWVNLFKQRLKK